MKSKSIFLAAFLVIWTLCFIQAAYYYPLLPETVPSHFGASGRPEAWSSKNSLMIFYLIVVVGCPILILGLSYGLSRIPLSLINLLHKEFWIAPERKEKTLTYLSKYFLGFGSATLLLLLDVFHRSFQVALGEAKTLSHPMAVLVVYLAVLFVWTARMVVKFSSPHDD